MKNHTKKYKEFIRKLGEKCPYHIAAQDLK
jgi:hypothetical protein